MDCRLGVEDLGDALGAGHGFGEVGREFGHSAQRLVNVIEVGDDQHQFARQHPALEDLQRAEENGHRRAQRGDDFRGAIGGRLQPRQTDALLQGLRGSGIELFLLVFFAAEGLDQRNGGEHFAHARNDPALLLALPFDGSLGPAVAMEHAVAEDGQGGQRDQADAPVHGEHDAQHPDHHHEVRREFQEIASESVPQGAGIASDAGQKIAGPRPGVERQGEPLQMGEELPAQRIDHGVTRRGSDERLRVGQRSGAQGDHHNRAGSLGHDQHFAGRENALEKPQKVRERFVQDGMIQDHLERPRLEQVHRGAAQGTEDGQGQTPFDPAQVPHQELTETGRFERADFRRRFREGPSRELVRQGNDAAVGYGQVIHRNRVWNEVEASKLGRA